MSIRPPRADLVIVGVLLLGSLTFLLPADHRVEPVAVIDLPGPATAIAIVGPFAFAAVDGKALHVFDLRKPAELGPVARLDLPGTAANALSVSGQHLVIAGGEAGLKLVDISDPFNPQEVERISIPGEARDVVTKRRMAFVAAGRGGVRVIDLRTSVEVGHIAMPGEAQAIAIRDSRVFVAAGDYGLRIIDISDPTAPVEVASCFLPGASALDVAVDRTRVFVAGGQGGLRVVDISQPSNPVELDGDLSIEALSVELSGKHLLVAVADDGLHLHERNSGRLVPSAGQMETRGRATGVVAASGFAFVMSDFSLFEVFGVGGDDIFSDGFESGDMTVWSSYFPPEGWVDCELLTIDDLREGGNSQIATVTSDLEVEVEITRTQFTYPLWAPDSTMYVDYFAVSEDSHFSAYWDGNGYSPIDVETQQPEFAVVEPGSSTLWYVDFDGTYITPEHWNGTFEVCLDLRVVGTDFTCSEICTSETWTSTLPTRTPTGTVTPTRTPTVTRTPTFPPPTPTPTPTAPSMGS